MTIAPTAAALATVTLLAIVGPLPAGATDIDDYRWTHDLGGCRVVETQMTNRWGTDVTVRRRVCG